MIDARGDGSFDALQPPGEGVKPSRVPADQASPRLVAQTNNTRARVRLSPTLQIRHVKVCRGGPGRQHSSAGRAMRCSALASACRANAAAKQGEQAKKGLETGKKKKPEREKKTETATKGPSGDHPSCSTTPQRRPKEAIEDCPRAMIGGPDSTVRRRLQTH